MSKEQAIQLLRQVCEKYLGTYQDHLALQQALLVVGKLIEPPKTKEKK